VAEKSQIDVIDKTGKLVYKVNLALQEESEQILAVYSDYIFVRRFPSWNLEVYNMWTGIMVWDLVVHRATVTVNYDSATEIVYITTTNFISAREIATGNEIWRIDKVTRTGILDSGVLYYYSETSADSGSISAVDIKNRDKTWKAEMLLKNRAVYNLMIFDDTLIVSTDVGLIALNKKYGHEMWKSETKDFFYGKPVLINNVLYARGTDTRIIYAISPENGRYLGYLHLGHPPLLISTFHKEYDIVYKYGDLLIFPFEKTVYAFQGK
jgi:outer membrane protein assembly factor BamB